MKKIKIGVLVLLVAMLTACGNSNYIVDDEGTVVEYEATGQILQKDILCKPEDKDLDELYQSMEIKQRFRMKIYLFVVNLVYLVIRLMEFGKAYLLSLLLF